MATTKKTAKAETKDLEDLFLDGLKDLYYAEKKILRALPKMAKGAESEEVTAAFEKHRAETEGQVERLDQVIELFGKPARGKTCPAIDGILEEGSEILEEYKGAPAWTLAWWQRPRRSSITRSPAMGPSSRGRNSLESPKRSNSSRPPSQKRRQQTKRSPLLVRAV